MNHQAVCLISSLPSRNRLRSDLLEGYLRREFPGYKDFDIQVRPLRPSRSYSSSGRVLIVRAQLSVDGKEFYTFETPKALTRVSQLSSSLKPSGSRPPWVGLTFHGNHRVKSSISRSM
ncbi:hypothetical protein F5144DRAFT_570533 [Chaetomium tenue]|uniref:Uncharacterized protein n=1 Tax=Chaetomium tenue TaxID=1854479 RepID=A0ACB7P5C7_9PEZI|nr:hypothetical protein F5144DRAFT_570533 [Chaetomium globosum]